MSFERNLLYAGAGLFVAYRLYDMYFKSKKIDGRFIPAAKPGSNDIDNSDVRLTGKDQPKFKLQPRPIAGGGLHSIVRYGRRF
jgi:hypothetical protein